MRLYVPVTGALLLVKESNSILRKNVTHLITILLKISLHIYFFQ